MKKIFLLVSFLVMISIVSFGQDKDNAPLKKPQSELYNDFFAGYGGLSIYYFTGDISPDFYYPDDYVYYNYHKDMKDPVSAGTFYFGFSRTLNTVISMGFMFGYQKLTSTGVSTLYQNGTNIYYPVSIDNNLITGLARITFCYLDKDIFRMYSGIGVGVTLDFAKETTNGTSVSDRKIMPAGQMTIMGMRVGRALGGFAEFGIGSYGIFNAGISYKFGE